MRPDLPAPTTTTTRKQNPYFVVYPITETPRELLLGTASGGVDYTNYTKSMSHSSTTMNVQVVLPSSITTPIPGQCVSITDTINGTSYTIFNGVIESVNGPRNVRGAEKVINFVIRRRDASSYWRGVKRVTRQYFMGTDLGYMARDIAEQAGLQTDEYSLPNVGVSLLHDSAQLSDMTLWDMLNAVGKPAILEPFIDGRGFLKWVSRDIRIAPTYTLTDWTTVLETGGINVGPRPTAVRVKYTSPNLVKVVQQERLLATATLTCGVFKAESRLEVWWSDDHKQRAQDIRFVASQSINDGAIGSIGSETFSENSSFGGVIETRMDYFQSGVTIAIFIAGLVASHHLPDPVQVVPLTGTGATIPSWGGGLVRGLYMTAMLYFILRSGTGIYNVYGKPYDYVHEVNEIEAYDANAPDWAEQIEIVESSLIPNLDVAQSIAQSELMYLVKASGGGSMLMVNDYRFEPGDVFLLPDATRFRISDYHRDLVRDGNPSPAEIELEGFFV